MEKLTQKWCIVSLLEPCKEGFEFHMTDWPLHITLAGVHDVNWRSERLLGEFSKLLEGFEIFSVNTTESGLLGQTKVVFVEKSQALSKIHNLMMSFLDNHGSTFNNPEWQREGYIPHSTIQKHGQVSEYSVLNVDNIAIVDMFPNQDGSMRKLTKVYNFPKIRVTE